MRCAGQGESRRAACDRFALRPFDRRAAGRTPFRHRNAPRGLRPFRLDHFGHLRDHVAGAMHHDRVAQPQIEALDFVHVVQGRVRHRGAPDKDGRELGDGGDGAGAAYLELHAPQFGRRLFRRILVGDGPPRSPRHIAEGVLHGEGVDLNDNAIDVVTEVLPFRQQG